MKIEEKVRNSNKRYENRREGTNFKGKYAKQRNETFFSVSRNNSKHFFRIFVFFKFCETIATWRNDDLFSTVSHFAKLKKKKKLSTLPRTVKKYVSSFPFYELGKKVYLVCQELCGSGSQFFSLLQLWAQFWVCTVINNKFKEKSNRTGNNLTLLKLNIVLQ